jgi:hypothetical protein
VSTGGVTVRGVLHHAAIVAGDRLAGSTTWRRWRTSDPVRVVELLGCAREAGCLTDEVPEGDAVADVAVGS